LPEWSIRTRTWLGLALRCALALFFIAAGVVKLTDLHAFAVQVERYGLLPPAWIDPVALVLPLAEVTAGLLTALGRRIGLLAIGLLLLLFMVVLGYALWQGLEVPCGCFSLEDTVERYGLQKALLRDLLMLGAVAYLLRRQRLVAG
jgi:uncharacterized membrane protein YphA (DoxX/SURF4 family)